MIPRFLACATEWIVLPFSEAGDDVGGASMDTLRLTDLHFSWTSRWLHRFRASERVLS